MTSLFQKVTSFLRVKKKVEEPKRVEKPKKRPTEVALWETKAKEALLEAKDEAFRIRRTAEEETKKLQEEIRQKEIRLEKRSGALEEKEKALEQKRKALDDRIIEIEKIRQEQAERLEKVAKLTREEAKDLLMKATEKHLKEDLAKLIKEEETKAKEEAERKAREILIDAMRQGATDYVAEYTVSTVKLKDEEMKGRIIGKEGRNIRTFERITGVDVNLDEEGVIQLSSFDPVRREIARIALEKLIADGRIQPTRIEEIFIRTKKDIERIMYKEGEKLAHQVGVYNLPHDKITLLGRFKYRFSYGQNMIAHTLEETKIGVKLAHEVGANVNIVRLGCLLHDIGKVITEKEGNHIELGVELLKKNGIPQAVVDCVAQHHEDSPFTSIESVIVYIADSISGSRPGARLEDYEEYMKRLSRLEEVAKSFKGVKEAYAFQAGRELRVIADPGELDDDESKILASKIKQEIEKKMTYPGQVKITVIRELRTSETVK